MNKKGRQKAWIPLIILIISGMLVIGGVSAIEFGPWSVETVDSGGKVGQYSSVALDPAGNPAISYYDETYGDLKYASWDGSTWVITTVDCSRCEGKNRWFFWDQSHDRTQDSEYKKCYHGTEKVGKYSSLAFDSAGKPRISFYDETKGDLKYATWDGSTWIISTVYSIGKVGEYSSLALDSSDNPRISFFDAKKNDLKYASWNGAKWIISTVDSSKKAGEYSSLALDSSGKPCISYFDAKKNDLKYASWNGAKWIISTVDSSKKVGKFSSIALDSSDNPRISYYDQTNKDLKYASWDGTRWVITTVDSSKRVGEYSSLTLDANGDPRISYYDATHKDLKFAAWDSTHSQWQTETVDSSGKVGSFSSLALDSLGNPRISYYDQKNKDLKYAAGTGQTQNPPAPTITGIIPDSGVAGTLVSITDLAGANFVTGTTPAVKLTKIGEADIIATNITVVSPSQITCTLPLPASATSVGSWDAVVTNEDGQSGSMPAAFTVLSEVIEAPTVTSITPATGVAGTSVSVTNLAGTGFLSGATVKLTKSGSPDIIAMSVTVDSSTAITCTLPLPAPSATSAGQWDVVVTNTDGQFGSLANGFAVTNPAPTVTGITPDSSFADTLVFVTNLEGTNFIVDTTPAVWLEKSGQGPITATDVTVVSPGQITCTLPLPPWTSTIEGQWDVVVKNVDGLSGSKSGAFTILTPAPTVTSITPDHGFNGTVINPVVIEGTNFGFGTNPSIWLAKTGETNISGTDVHIYGTTKMDFVLNIPLSAPAGTWDVMVMSQDGKVGAYLGAFTIESQVNDVPLVWDWSVDGWGDWQYETIWDGTEIGPCSEYGPVMETGYGEYGSSLTLEDRSGMTESSVWKTFTAPAGTTWNTLTFSGLLSPVTYPFTRSMTIFVNSESVFSADASQIPPGNGQQFTITKTFQPTDTVTVKISAKADPTFGSDTTLYTMQFNSLTLN